MIPISPVMTDQDTPHKGFCSDYIHHRLNVNAARIPLKTLKKLRDMGDGLVDYLRRDMIDFYHREYKGETFGNQGVITNVWAQYVKTEVWKREADGIALLPVAPGDTFSAFSDAEFVALAAEMASRGQIYMRHQDWLAAVEWYIHGHINLHSAPKMQYVEELRRLIFALSHIPEDMNLSGHTERIVQGMAENVRSFKELMRVVIELPEKPKNWLLENGTLDWTVLFGLYDREHAMAPA